LNPAASGKKEEEEDHEKNNWFQMPASLDVRLIGSNAGDKLAQSIVQHGTAIERGMLHIERGMVKGSTILERSMVLASSIVALAFVPTTRWIAVGNLLAPCSKIIFANKMIMVASKMNMLAANTIMLAIHFAVCLRVAVALLKWASVDLKEARLDNAL
jgi:hypothetical protein